ncbi:hypothetical protein [Thalassotalea litorea]|uniref:hypothetical protein n=1 Tax=Thalassotalea litorea TaxID=2020715 RepID=UPI003736FC46
MLNLESVAESIALHRAILQAKFAELEPFDSAIPYSKPLADIAKRNLDSIIEVLSEQGEELEAKLWSESRNLDSDWNGFSLIKTRIQLTSSWPSYSEAEKIKLIEVLCSPFVPSQQQLNELLLVSSEA